MAMVLDAVNVPQDEAFWTVRVTVPDDPASKVMVLLFTPDIEVRVPPVTCHEYTKPASGATQAMLLVEPAQTALTALIVGVVRDWIGMGNFAVKAFPQLLRPTAVIFTVPEAPALKVTCDRSAKEAFPRSGWNGT